MRSCQPRSAPAAQRRFRAETPPPTMELPACQCRLRNCHPCTARGPNAPRGHSPGGHAAGDGGGVSRCANNWANRADALGAPALRGVARRHQTLIATGEAASLRRKTAWVGRTTGSHGPTGAHRPLRVQRPRWRGSWSHARTSRAVSDDEPLQPEEWLAPSGILGARWDGGRWSGGPDGARRGAMRHRHRRRGGAGACAHVHRPQCPIGWKLATLPVQCSNMEAFVSRGYPEILARIRPHVPGSVPVPEYV